VIHVSAEQLDAEGLDLIARGYAKRAEAARLRSTQSTAAGDWIRVDELPVPKRSALAAARSGTLRAVKQGRVWLTTRIDADAWLARAKPAAPANDGDDDVRAALGLVVRRAS
jgi:hypothetical protein